MPHYFRAVAIDYDGTMTDDGTANIHALAATDELRRRGRHVVLCTGRIMSELRAVFPEVEQHFDAIVAENGAVISLPGRAERAVAAPLPEELLHALLACDVPVRSGDVLLATKAHHDVAVLHEIARLELDAQLVRNRGELMVLPAGVSKATGLLDALAELDVSHHSTIGIGDAENDYAMLQACEVGVAVANAVDSVRERADIVLDEPDGAGVATFLLGPVLTGEVHAAPARWHIELGRSSTGEAATVPGSRLNNRTA